MNKEQNTLAMLRKKAEGLLKKKSPNSDSQLSETDILKLIHELEVHHIELEIKNEELKLAKIRSDESSDKYTELFNFNPMGFFILSREGEIIELNFCGASILGKERSRLINAQFGFFVSKESKPDFNQFLESVFSGKEKISSELTLSVRGKSPVYVYLTGIVSRNEGNCLLSVIDITERKLAEQKLTESEQLYKKLFENSGSCNVIIDKEGKYLWVNKKAAEEFGVPIGEIEGKTMFDLLPELTAQKYYKRNKALIESGEKREYEDTFMLPTGQTTFLIIDQILQDESGNNYAILSSSIDITDRKKAEAALLESETQFRSFFDNSLAGISVASPDGTLLQANEAYARMYGYKNREELFAEVKNIRQFYANAEDRKEILENLCSKGIVEDLEVEVVRRDGSHFFVIVSASEVRDKDGNLLYNQATHLDLTERKKAEETLRKSETRFHELFRNMFEGYAYCQMIYKNGEAIDWIYLEVNEKFEQLTGLYGVKGKKVSEVIPGLKESDPKLFEHYSKVAFSGQPDQFEYFVEALHDWYSVSVYCPEKGFFVAIFDVITKRKLLEEERKQSQEKLRDFATMLQHSREEERKGIAREIHDEFGQVLTALKMNLTLLGNEVKTSEKSLVVKNIYEEIDNMKKIIDNTIQRVREFTNKLRPDILDTFGLIEALDVQISEFSKLHSIKSNYIKPDEIEIDSDKSIAVYRIVQEALTNVARHANATEVTISLGVEGKYLKVMVEDNGSGIIEKDMGDLKKFGITGMKERAFISGGALNILSYPGKGTRIELTIPIE